MARHGVAQLGTACYGTARHSVAQLSTARHGTSRDGTARCSVARLGTAWRGAAWHSTTLHSVAWHSTAQLSSAQRGTAQRGAAWHGSAQHVAGQHRFVQEPAGRDRLPPPAPRHGRSLRVLSRRAPASPGDTGVTATVAGPCRQPPSPSQAPHPTAAGRGLWQRWGSTRARRPDPAPVPPPPPRQSPRFPPRSHHLSASFLCDYRHCMVISAKLICTTTVNWLQQLINVLEIWHWKKKKKKFVIRGKKGGAGGSWGEPAPICTHLHPPAAPAQALPQSFPPP